MPKKHSFRELKNAVVVLRYPAGEKDDSKEIIQAAEILNEAISELVVLRNIMSRFRDCEIAIESYREHWRY